MPFHASRREQDPPASETPPPAASEPIRLGQRADVHALLVNSVRDYAIFALDSTGRVATWNPGAERMKGYRQEEIVGRHFSTFYPDDDVARGKPAQELRIAAEFGRFEDEGWRIRKDGSRFWANVIITAMREPGGKLVGFSKVTRDLSERRQAEEALRQSEEKFRLLVANVVDYAIFLLDPQGLVQSWNAGAQQLKGYRASEIVGESFERFYPAEERATGKPRRELEIASSVGRYEEEGWRIRKDGSRFWANVVITALREPASGRLIGFAKVTRDLTMRKRAEQELQAAYQDMEAFSYTASHDLRAPLHAILALAEHSLQHEGPLTPDLESNLKAIAQSSERASHLVEDLLEFARLSAGMLTTQSVDLGELAREVHAELASREPQRAVELVLDDAANLRAVADPALARVLLTNLLANAWKFTRPTERAIIRFGSTGRMDESRVFYVSDNGVGFQPETASQLFQPFRRYHSATEFSGTGIGLATVQRIANRHGGRAWAEGIVNGGAAFYFSLPDRTAGAAR